MNYKSNLRPCMVKGERAWFHKWNTIQQVIEPSPMMGGHQGGQIQYTLGLIERPDGSVFEVPPRDIEFINSADLNGAADVIRKEMLTHGAWYIAMVRSIEGYLNETNGSVAYDEMAQQLADRLIGEEQCIQ